jgi:hypothetical protein
MQALATNARDSLEALMVSGMRVALIGPLLAECHCLKHLTLYRCNTAAMQIIGQTCKAPLKFVKIAGGMTDDAVRAIVPALSSVVFLRIKCSDETVLQHIIPQCPCLQLLRIRSPDIIKRLRSEIPKHITVIS